jgi:peptide/nickel transport system substrate-binding protein
MGSGKAKDRRSKALVLGAVVIVLMFVLGGALYLFESQENASPRVLVYYSAETVLSLDPADAADRASMVPIGNIYDTLVVQPADDPRNFTPSLAESWAVSDDNIWYNFTLRKGVKFSNGNTFNATDVKFTVDRILRMGSPESGVSARLAQYLDLNSTKVLDEYSVSFALRHPYAGFLSLIAQPLPLGIEDKEYTMAHYSVTDKYAHDFMKENPMGTGPYKAAGWSKGSEVVLVRNPSYWRGWEGSDVDKVIIREVSRSFERISALESGQADISDVPLENISGFVGMSDIALQTYRSLRVEIVAMNVNESRGGHAFMRDTNVRRALAYAFDYANVSNGIYDRNIADIRGCIPLGMPFEAESQPRNPFVLNLSESSRLLNASGYHLDEHGHRFNGTPVDLFVRSGDSLRAMVADAFAVNLQRLGILINREVSNAVGPLGTRSWDLFMTCWDARYLDPDDAVTALAVSRSQGDVFNTGIRDGVIDDAAARARSSNDNGTRTELYHLIWDELGSEPNMIFVGQINRAFGLDAKVHGLSYHPITGLSFYGVWKSGK